MYWAKERLFDLLCNGGVFLFVIFPAQLMTRLLIAATILRGDCMDAFGLV